MYYPTLQNIELIIKQMNKRYNMSVVITNKGQLDFALEKPKTKLFGQEQYPELYQKAAILMESITKIHALSDGNKRTAMMAAEFLIKANGGELVLPLKAIRLSVDTAMDSEDEMTELIQQWFKVHTAMNVHQLCAILYEQIEEETIIQKLWTNKQYQDVEDLIGKWMAFDSYPENKHTWNELKNQWKKNQRDIQQQNLKSDKIQWSEMWGSIMNMAKRDHEQYGDYFITPVEKISDLKHYSNSMDELKKMENKIKKLEPKYAKTSDPKIIHQNAMILQRHGNYDEAISLFEKLRTIDKDESDALHHIATILQYVKGDPNTALEYWHIFEKNNPDLGGAAEHIGIALTDLKQYDDALGYLEKALKHDSNSQRSSLYKGICYEELENYDKAIRCYEKCLSINKKNIGAYWRLAECYLEKDQFDKSIEFSDKAIQLDPKDFRGYYNKGRILHVFQKYDEALIEYKKALKMNPNNIEIIINIGSAVSDSGKRKEAVPYFQKALESDPNHPVALSSLALTLVFLRKFDDALIHVERLLKLQPDHRHATMTKATIFANTGKIIESLTMFEKLYKKYPEIKEALIENLDGILDPIKDSERFKQLIQ